MESGKGKQTWQVVEVQERPVKIEEFLHLLGIFLGNMWIRVGVSGGQKSYAESSIQSHEKIYSIEIHDLQFLHPF